jgi:hypothetical protein
MKPDALLADCHQWHKFWLPTAISQQPVGQFAKQPVSQILSIPWGHNLDIPTMCKQHEVLQETVTMKTSATETGRAPQERLHID